jgi:hypothetical protein
MVSKRNSFRALMPALGVALVASLVLAVVGVASASAATQHWYVDGSKLAEGTPTNVTIKNTTNFNLGWTYVGGQKWEFKCTSQNGEGTVENPVGGGAGSTTTKFTLNGCTRVAPSGEAGWCKLSGGAIAMEVNGGTATEFEAKSAVKFNPFGGQFTEFWLTNCPLERITLSGSFTGIAAKGPTGWVFEFTKASSAMSWGPYPATLVGTSKLETTTGKSVTIAP